MNSRFVPRIERPCLEDWNSMKGDEKRRFCDRCQLHVHNLSAMSRDESEAVLADRKTRQCVGYVVKGSQIRVRTGVWLWWQRLCRPWRAGLAFLALSLPFASAADNPPAPMATPALQKVEAATPAPTPVVKSCPAGPMMLGEISAPPPRPLWRRILFFWEA